MAWGGGRRELGVSSVTVAEYAPAFAHAAALDGREGCGELGR